MAEFLEVMLEMNRMHNDYNDCEDGCPLYGMGFCDKPECEVEEEDIREAERIIMKWSKEHPVVYPTWGEFLGEFFQIADLEDIRFTDPIRVDIAKKLGLKPKRNKK